MQRKKPTAQGTASERGQSSALPAGFVNTSGSGDFPQTWEPKKAGESLQGVVTAKRFEDAKKLKRKKAKKGEKVGILVVADENGELFTLWESHALRSLIQQANIGDSVYVRFEGVKKLTGGKRLKEFTTGFAPKKGKK